MAWELFRFREEFEIDANKERLKAGKVVA